MESWLEPSRLFINGEKPQQEFWQVHLLFTINWIIAWSQLGWIPQRVHWFFNSSFFK